VFAGAASFVAGSGSVVFRTAAFAGSAAFSGVGFGGNTTYNFTLEIDLAIPDQQLVTLAIPDVQVVTLAA
jgi:hypothetical protein